MLARSIPLVVLGALLAPLGALAQDLSSTNNITSLYGTWSSGSGNVITGIGFADPLNYSFTYPLTTGIAYSFTDDGFFEEAQYRFNSNNSKPNCIQAVVFFQHGTYEMHTNGSLVLTPFAADGRIQVQDPCAAETNLITLYEQTTLYSDWGIQVDTVKQNYALQLAKFDGAPMPPLYLIQRPPSMLPTVELTGYGMGLNVSVTKRGLEPELAKRSAGARVLASSTSWAPASLVLGALGLVAAVF